MRKFKLTPTEWQILEIFIKNDGKLITKVQLSDAIRGKGFEKDQGYLRLYISQLRQKLERSPASPVQFFD
ncbi:MAG: winged helix-turn-helix domain-containing protein [Actinomycetota bacterium]